MSIIYLAQRKRMALHDAQMPNTLSTEYANPCIRVLPNNLKGHNACILRANNPTSVGAVAADTASMTAAFVEPIAAEMRALMRQRERVTV